MRADIVENKKVITVDYSSYEQMTLEQMTAFGETIIEKYSLTCMHVYHSLGKIKTGEICLFVFTSAPHRKAAIEAFLKRWNDLKRNCQSRGREIFEDDSFQWKINQPL